MWDIRFEVSFLSFLQNTHIATRHLHTSCPSNENQHLILFVLICKYPDKLLLTSMTLMKLPAGSESTWVCKWKFIEVYRVSSHWIGSTQHILCRFMATLLMLKRMEIVIFPSYCQTLQTKRTKPTTVWSSNM